MSSLFNDSISKKRPHSDDGDQNSRKLKIAKTHNFICWKISEWSLKKFKAKIEKYGCDFLLEQFKMCHHEKDNSQENVEKFQSILSNIRQCGQVDLQSKVQSFFTKLITEQKSQKLNLEPNTVVHILEAANSIESLLNQLKNSPSLEGKLFALKELKVLASKEETANKLIKTDLLSIFKDLIISNQMPDPKRQNDVRSACLVCLMNLQQMSGISLRLHQNVHFSRIISWSLTQMSNNNTLVPLLEICCLVSNMTVLQGEVGKSIVEKYGIEAFMNCLKNEDIKILRYTLKSLSYLLYEEEVVNKMVRLGVVEIFMKYIHHTDKDICKYSCGGFSFLSANGQTRAIVEAGGIPILLKLTSSDVPEIQERAMGALANIAEKNFCERVHQEGGLDLLIDLVEKRINDDMVNQQVFRTLSYMTTLQEPVIKEMLNKGVVRLFIQNCSSKNLKNLQFISYGLFNLVKVPNVEMAEEIAEYIVHNGGIEALIKLADQQDLYVRKNALFSLFYLSISKQCNHVIDHKGIETFLKFINETEIADIISGGLAILANTNPQKVIEKCGISAFACLLRRPTETTIDHVLRSLLSISSIEQSLMAMSFNSKLPSLLFSIDDPRAKNLIEQFKAQESLSNVLGSINFEELPLLALNLALLFPKKNPLEAKKGIIKMLVQYHEIAVKEVSPTIQELPLPFYCYLMALDNLNDQKTETVKILKIQGKEEQLQVAETPDLQLFAGEEKESIPCHRQVMIDSSDYFKSMFNVSMKEQEQSAIRLQEISTENLQRLIDLSYNKTVIFSRRELFDLLALADRYQMQAIKSSLWKCLLEDQISIGELPEEKAHNLEDFEHVLELLVDNFEDTEGAELVPFLDWIISHWRWFKEKKEASTCLLNFLPRFNNLI